MTPRFNPQEFALSINRRTFLGQAAYGLGGLALACLMDPKLLRAADSTAADANAFLMKRGLRGPVIRHPVSN